MQDAQHKKAWQYLRKLALSLGGRVVYVRYPSERGYQLAGKNPGDDRFAIAWRAKVVYCLYQPKAWPRLLHELAHVFATELEPYELESDFELLGWEFAGLRAIASQDLAHYHDACVHWLSMYGGREVDFEHKSAYFTDIDDLHYKGTQEAMNAFLAERVADAKARGIVSSDGQLLTLRT